MKSSVFLFNCLFIFGARKVLGVNNIAGLTVDLGYGLWQASVNVRIPKPQTVQLSLTAELLQESGHYYNFSNIRYGQAPIGELRFAAPQPPLVNRTTVNDGQDGRIYPQGYVSWTDERSLFLDAYLKGNGNLSSFANVPPPGINTTAMPPAQKDPRANEDCLFLDVIVPESVYNRTDPQASRNVTSKAPVLVWTFGGGFHEGDKESQGNPAGLVAKSMSAPASSPGAVYVALNYRLGALGWLSGPTFTASGGTPNAGLHDQRLARYWIQEHIHLFGGDPNRVTIMGESAGASMSMHQITAFGGTQNAPFQQAVMGSPGSNPNPYNWLQEETYQNFLTTANATT